MFKIALNAGHYYGTPGKRCLNTIDPAETREWTLNSRICEKVERKLQGYDGYELLRIDDRTGKSDITIADRAAKANRFGADIYVAVHHNAGINGGSGGGIMAFTYLRVDDYTKRMQRLLYDKLIEKTGLKGNRAQPLSTADLGECRLTKMPAVLLECGFMDSTSDTPIILTEDFADKAAAGITEAIAELGALTKKAEPVIETADKDGGLYYVQVGAYRSKSNAEEMVKRLKNAGFDAIIKR